MPSKPTSKCELSNRGHRQQEVERIVGQLEESETLVEPLRAFVDRVENDCMGRDLIGRRADAAQCVEQQELSE